MFDKTEIGALLKLLLFFILLAIVVILSGCSDSFNKYKFIPATQENIEKNICDGEWVESDGTIYKFTMNDTINVYVDGEIIMLHRWVQISKNGKLIKKENWRWREPLYSIILFDKKEPPIYKDSRRNKPRIILGTDFYIDYETEDMSIWIIKLGSMKRNPDAGYIASKYIKTENDKKVEKKVKHKKKYH